MDIIRRSFLPERKSLVILALVLVTACVAFEILPFLVNWFFMYYHVSSSSIQGGGNGILHFIFKILLETGVGMVIFIIVDAIERTLGRGRMDLRLINS